MLISSSSFELHPAGSFYRLIDEDKIPDQEEAENI